MIRAHAAMSNAMQEALLTREQAYAATFRYLEILQESVHYDLLQSLLSRMQLLDGGSSADPVCKHDWDRAVSDVLGGNVDIRFRLLPIPSRKKLTWKFWAKPASESPADRQETEDIAEQINQSLGEPVGGPHSLTKHQAYATTFRYLHIVQEATGDDLLHAMFTSMPIMQDGISVDSACSHDWDQAVTDVLDGKVDIQFRLLKTREQLADPKLTQGDLEVIKECLVAAVDGPFFPDWEFSIIFGVDRSEVGDVLAKWPDLDWQRETVRMAVGNAFNNLLGYPHGMADEWDKYISIRPVELNALYDKLPLPRGIM